MRFDCRVIVSLSQDMSITMDVSKDTKSSNSRTNRLCAVVPVNLEPFLDASPLTGPRRQIYNKKIIMIVRFVALSSISTSDST